MAGRAAAVALAKKPFVRYWIAGDDYEYGHSIADATWNNLKRLNPKVQLLGQSWWKAGGDFTPYIPQIIAAKPDFLIAATGGATMINFQKAAKATGLSQKIPFYQHAATEHSTLEFLGASAPEGVYGTNAYFFYYPKLQKTKHLLRNIEGFIASIRDSGPFMATWQPSLLRKDLKKPGRWTRKNS